MDKIKFKNTMKERYRILTECEDNWGDGIDLCCKDAIAVIADDIPGFINYLKTECASQDYLFITEWLDEIVDAIKSQELIDAFRETMNFRFLEENQKYHIEQDLEDALKFYGDGTIY